MLNLEGVQSRPVMQGINQFVLADRRWVVRTIRADAPSVDKVASWRPDGVIAAAATWPMIDKLKALGIPVVNVSGRIANQPFPQVTFDNKAVGRMSAEYFIEKGHRNFAMLGDPESDASERRWAGFCGRLAEAGLRASLFEIREGSGVHDHWEKAETPLARWLKSLPKPVAVACQGDSYALLVNQVCLTAGIQVPEQAAILGSADEPLLCNQGYPPLSSVRIAGEQMGHEAARILATLLSGGQPPPEPIRLAPLGVTTRASTDMLAIDDADVVAAARHIAQHACDGLQAREVVAAIPVARRALERRFRKAMGRTLLEEIHRVRIEHAKFLLTTTLMSMPEVARRSGFESSHRMWEVFHRVAKASPTTFRQTSRS